jgi:hypothetical protein
VTGFIVVGRGFFVLDDAVEDLPLSDAVIRLLFDDGVIDQLRFDAGLSFEMAGHEEDELPSHCLLALAGSSRRSASQYQASPSVRLVKWRSWTSVGGWTEQELKVDASEAYAALMKLADLAEHAASRNLPVYVAL